MKKSGKKRKRVTMSDIAEACGVSRPIVSVILSDTIHPTLRYGEETAREVKEMAHKMGYRRNTAVEALKRGRHNAFALLVSNFYKIPEHAVFKFAESLKTYDQTLRVEIAIEGEIPESVKEFSVDGIVMFEQPPAELAQEIKRVNLPLVLVNTDKVKGAGSVLFDEENGGRIAARHLKEQGCRNIAYCSDSEEDIYYIREREQSIFDACAELNLKKPLKLQLPGDNADRTAAVARFLKKHPKTDAVLLQMTQNAPAVYKGIKQAGLSIPDDICMIGYNDNLVNEAMDPPLSSLSVHPGKLGDAAAEMLNKVVESHRTPRSVKIPYKLKVRASSERNS